DWNGNDHFGVDDPSDYDLDLDAHRDVAMFRYPVFHDDGTVTHPGGSGVAMEAGFVNSRGLLVDATLWVPGELVEGMDAPSDIVTLRTEKRPAIAFASGISSSQVDYYWFAESMAARGYVVLTYDPVGQGQSEGTWSDTFQQGAGTGDCGFGGACLDVQDAVRWLVGTPITPRTDLTGLENGQVRPFDPAKDPAGGPLNPISKLVDVRNVGLAGNSMGALSTLNYLTTLASGSSPDGRPLPLVKAAVAMSGATPGATTKVPLQLQTSDFDGSPTLVGPGLGGVSLGGAGQGIGYYPIKDMFDRIRPNASRDLSLVVMAGGVHTDHVAVPYVPRTLWSIHLASHYAGAWFDCHIKGSGRACAATRVGIAHLSSAFGSELDPTGPANELCLATPTTMSLNYDAQDLAALRPRSCHGRANP
ncbi:MAG: CocE/NonD family hydrolase, partial [Acidimicrobiales bacterium]